jgi:nitrile hydratase
MKNINPPTHTRLPRYARGKVGVIEKLRGHFVFPDTNAHGGGEDPQWCYNVRFNAQELWGEDADPTISVSIDAFEPYLENA